MVKSALPAPLQFLQCKRGLQVLSWFVFVPVCLFAGHIQVHAQKSADWSDQRNSGRLQQLYADYVRSYQEIFGHEPQYDGWGTGIYLRINQQFHGYIQAIASDQHEEIQLDGRTFLSAEAVCVSCRKGSGWKRAERDSEGHGGQTAEGHHEPGHDRHVDLWSDPSGNTGFG